MLGTRPVGSPSESTGRVIAVRLRGTISRLFRSSRRTDDHDVDDAILPTSRRVRQSFMSVNSVLFSVAEAIPVFGTSIKGALEALYKVLDLVETRYQIQEDTEALLKRIESLVYQLTRTLTPSTALVTLISQLEATSRCLECLLRKKHLRYHVVAKSIDECRSHISEYLNECMLFTVVEIQASMRAKEVTIESIIVMDPFGCKQIFPKPQIADIALLAEWVLERYDGNPQLQSLLKGFVDRVNFEITIDDGTKAIPVSPEVLPHLASDTKIVMSVVTYTRATSYPRGVFMVPCPLCNKDIPMEVSVCDFDCERVFCPRCDRNVQAYFLPETRPEAPIENPQDVNILLRNIIVKPLLNWSSEQFEYDAIDWLKGFRNQHEPEETSHAYQEASKILAGLEENSDGEDHLEDFFRFVNENGHPHFGCFERSTESEAVGRDQDVDPASRLSQEFDASVPEVTQECVGESERVERTFDIASRSSSPPPPTRNPGLERRQKEIRVVVSRRYIGI